MARSFPESDWKLFRELRQTALERFCQRVLEDVNRLHQEDSRTYHERYLDLYRLLQSRDEDRGRAFNDPRRSTMFLQFAAIVGLGLVEPDELARFTPTIREALAALSSTVSD